MKRKDNHMRYINASLSNFEFAKLTNKEPTVIEGQITDTEVLTFL